MVQALAKEIEMRSKSTSNSQLPTPKNEVIVEPFILVVERQVF